MSSPTAVSAHQMDPSRPHRDRPTMQRGKPLRLRFASALQRLRCAACAGYATAGPRLDDERRTSDHGYTKLSPTPELYKFGMDMTAGTCKEDSTDSRSRSPLSLSLSLLDLELCDDDSNSLWSESTTATELSVRHSIYAKPSPLTQIDELGDSVGSQKSLLWSQYSPLAKDAPPPPGPTYALCAPAPPDSESVSTWESTQETPIVSLSIFHGDAPASIPQMVRNGQAARDDDGSGSCGSSTLGNGVSIYAPIARSPTSQQQLHTGIATDDTISAASSTYIASDASNDEDVSDDVAKLSPTALQDLERSFQQNYIFKGPLDPCDEADEENDSELEAGVYVPIY